MADDAILVINAGSSSLKFALFDRSAEPARIAGGKVERIGRGARLRASRAGEAATEIPLAPDAAQVEALDAALAWLDVNANGAKPGVVGHRVVHGGMEFIAPARIDDDVLDRLERLDPLAPLHQPYNLAAIRRLRERHPRLAQVACFDTAFHAHWPDRARRFALPRALHDAGVRRYGFHGTSHAYVSRRAAEFLGRPTEELRQIVLHLGNGASMCAIDGGRSVDTSMGLTPLQGLVMGTRSGDIDPSVLFHLAREGGFGVEELDTLLNARSGLLGLAGSGDMRDVRASADAGHADAQLAYDVTVHRIRHYLGAYLLELGGADTIIFTAGIGENLAVLRAAVISGLEWFGITIDPARNEAGDRGVRRISVDDSRVEVLVVPTDEEREIATQTLAALR